LRYRLQCIDCGREQQEWDGRSTIVGRCSCGGIIDVVYNLDEIEGYIDDRYGGIWRYWRLLPVEPKEGITADEGRTPLYRSKRLSEHVGLKNLWIKDETRNPTRTFKDREACITICRFLSLGIREFVLCSTGNTAASFSRVMSKVLAAIMHLLIPLSCRGIIDFEIPASVKAAFVDAPYHDVCCWAPDYASQNGIVWEGGFGNFYRREGLKTISLEIAECSLHPDWYVQAVGSGLGTYAAYRGFSELCALGATSKVPRLLCIQPELCAPMVNAFKAGRTEFSEEFAVPKPQTLATTIAQGNPQFSYKYVSRVIRESGGYMESVSESEIENAMKLMEAYESTTCEPASATALAGLIKCVESGVIDRGEIVVLIHSGGRREGRLAELPIVNAGAQPKELYALLMGRNVGSISRKTDNRDPKG